DGGRPRPSAGQSPRLCSRVLASNSRRARHAACRLRSRRWGTVAANAQEAAGGHHRRERCVERSRRRHACLHRRRRVARVPRGRQGFGGLTRMARVPLLAGNWKMHGTRTDATALAGALAKSVGTVSGREVLIAPPYTALAAARQAIAPTPIPPAAPNLHAQPQAPL